MKKLLALFTAVILVLQSTSNISAHILIADESGRYGAVLHILPGDDPAVNEPAQLFFDIKGDDFRADTYEFSLVIRNENGESIDTVIGNVGATSVQAETVFPARGVYKIELVGEKKPGDRLVFRHTQRVVRGDGGGVNASSRYIWAEVGLVAAITGIIAIVIIMISRRVAIAAYTYAVTKRKG